jgi:hypothetical protein
MQKFNNLIQRLTAKVKLSATPVTGFVLGMSGTDSIITYILLNEVAKTEGFKVVGIHVGYDIVFSETFEWLKRISYKNDYRTFDLSIRPNPPKLEGDYMRWAFLHETALLSRFWVASTVNATEKTLGTFSIMANSASIAPIASLYKSEVLECCKELGVPEAIIQRSRTPDCICGRDEFAAENIELIDLLLTNKYKGGYSDGDLIKAYDYIRETKKENDFKNRTPYSV